MQNPIVVGSVVREIEWMGQHPRDTDLVVEEVQIERCYHRVCIDGLWDDVSNYRLVKE